MKFASPTHQREMLRCPRRYQYRYLYSAPSEEAQRDHQKLRRLYGIRELAGHLIHTTMTDLVNSVGEGNGLGDYAAAGIRCREQFLSIVCQSLSVGPGEFTGGLQLAETFNGPPDGEFSDDVRFWRDSISTMVENGARAIVSLGIGVATSTYSVQTEQTVAWKSGTFQFRFILDAVMRGPYRTMVVDWKTHAIDDQDINQVRTYLRYLNVQEGIPCSRLYGFAVDLRREEIVPVTYEPFAAHRPRAIGFRPALKPENHEREAYPPKPNEKLCRRCPYRTICDAAA